MGYLTFVTEPQTNITKTTKLYFSNKYVTQIFCCCNYKTAFVQDQHIDY